MEMLLTDIADPIPFFLVFAVRYRDGTLSKRGKPVRSGTLDDILRDIGQMALMGRPDPRILPSGIQELRLKRLLKGFTKEDPPPERLQPASLGILQQLCHDTGKSAFDKTTRDLTIMGFFYLCHPGKAYAPSSPTTDSAPFCLCDVEFAIGTGIYRADSIPIHLLDHAQGVRLEFTTKKKCNVGEKIAHGLSGDELICPTKALIRSVKTSAISMHHAPHHYSAPTRIPNCRSTPDISQLKLDEPCYFQFNDNECTCGYFFCNPEQTIVQPLIDCSGYEGGAVLDLCAPPENLTTTSSLLEILFYLPLFAYYGALVPTITTTQPVVAPVVTMPSMGTTTTKPMIQSPVQAPTVSPSFRVNVTTKPSHAPSALAPSTDANVTTQPNQAPTMAPLAGSTNGIVTVAPIPAPVSTNTTNSTAAPIQAPFRSSVLNTSGDITRANPFGIIASFLVLLFFCVL